MDFFKDSIVFYCYHAIFSNMNKKIENILDHIAAPFGLTVLWKGVGTNYHDCGLAPEHTLHCNPFCRKVKSTPEGLKKCSENDNRFMPAEAEKRQNPFVRRCHAGVSELVVPILLEGHCREVLLLGVFREPGAGCTYRELRREFGKLPQFRGGRLSDAGSLLHSLVPVLRHYRETHRPDNRIKDRRIAEATAIIHREFAGKLTAAALAARIYLSESRFLHLFKKQAGYSFGEYLIKFRLDHAAELLKRTDLSIGEIMADSGFNDQSYFGTRFKKYTGYPPRRYRQKFAVPGDI